MGNDTDTRPKPTSRTNGKAKNGAAPLTFDHLLSAKKPVTRRVPINFDAEVVDEYNIAEAAYEAMTLTAETDLERQRTPEDRQREQQRQDAITTRRNRAESALLENQQIVVMQSPGRKRYEALVSEHPPTDEDIAEVKRMFGQEAEAPYHAETFGPALVSLCCIEPQMTPEQVQELFDEWNQQETTSLFAEALGVCTRSTVGTVGKGFGLTPGS